MGARLIFDPIQVLSICMVTCLLRTTSIRFSALPFPCRVPSLRSSCLVFLLLHSFCVAGSEFPLFHSCFFCLLFFFVVLSLSSMFLVFRSVISFLELCVSSTASSHNVWLCFFVFFFMFSFSLPFCVSVWHVCSRVGAICFLFVFSVDVVHGQITCGLLPDFL